MPKSKVTYAILRTITLLSQWLLAGTFLFSGFVKALDPMGMEHKLAAYFTHWGINLPAGSLYLDVAVLLLALVEFTLGVYLLLGMRKRVAAIGSFAHILSMQSGGASSRRMTNSQNFYKGSFLLNYRATSRVQSSSRVRWRELSRRQGLGETWAIR